MDALDDLLREATSSPNHLKEAIHLLQRILHNILHDPADERKWKLNGNNPTLRQALAIPSFSLILVHIGFRKTVVEFCEQRTIPRPNAPTLARLRDILSALEEFGERIPNEKTSAHYISAKERKQQHRDYVDLLLLQAEEACRDKLELERKKMDKLRQAQCLEKKEKARTIR